MAGGLLDVGVHAHEGALVTHPDRLGPRLGPLAEQLEAALREHGVAHLDAELLGHLLELERAPVRGALAGHVLAPHLSDLLVEHDGEVQPPGDHGRRLHAPPVRRGGDHAEARLLVQLVHLRGDALGQLDAMLGQRRVEGPRPALLGLRIAGVREVQPLAVPDDDERLLEGPLSPAQAEPAAPDDLAGGAAPRAPDVGRLLLGCHPNQVSLSIQMRVRVTMGWVVGEKGR
mmetsp:Transcript_73461/g.192657  ORF Transcript_73461/g.192657 Transcript_73461/m.192657 type:complete len:230 (+) Transcript_73461:802-1491(+)